MAIAVSASPGNCAGAQSHQGEGGGVSDCNVIFFLLSVIFLFLLASKSSGKVIELKSEDTDVETNRKPRQNRNKRFMRRQRKPRNSENNGENNVSISSIILYYEIHNVRDI